MKWVSVKEKLPIKNRKILVYSPTGSLHYPNKGNIFVADPEIYENGYISWDTISAAYETESVDITHWAELPQPPEGV